MSRTLRCGQVVSYCSPGAIVDIGDESFVTCAIEHWNARGLTKCLLPRLSNRLGVTELRRVRSEAQGFGAAPSSVALHRFPSWMFCQKCHRMDRWTRAREGQLAPDQRPRCKAPGCGSKLPLVPFRFVQICDRGHLSDVDWMYWVHSGRVSCQNRDPNRLKFDMSQSAGSGLGALTIECMDCGARASLGALMTPGRLRCRGRQPWQRSDAETSCDATAVVVQRGDSNVHFPSVVSALDIPTRAEGTAESQFERLHDHPLVKVLCELFRELLLNFEESFVLNRLSVTIDRYAGELGIDRDDLIKLVKRTDDRLVPDAPTSQAEIMNELRREEFDALSVPAEFEAADFEGTAFRLGQTALGSAMGSLIQSVSLIRRLREVRVVRGFHRLLPGDAKRLISVAESPQTHWLPAAEVFGEGIFLRMNAHEMAAWRAGLPAHEIDRIARLSETILDRGIRFLPTASPEFVALHGFAHVIMRQLAFDCGYASSSLRERIYCEPEAEQFGVLIYTADGDSEGTLGGLVRQGEEVRLVATIGRALQAASWCSGDPLCFEGESQGIAGLNRAACHSCMLVSETSCECSNMLLDRRFLIGDRGELGGLFRSFMNQMGIS